ncbi:MAG: hypothetical protein FJW80_08750 [Actinobacteria bacterium]|nr:hypothetical protein [Actinomycetota bacterium]
MRRIAALAISAALAASMVVAAQPASASGDWDLILKNDVPVIVDQHIVDGVVLTRVFKAVVRDSSGKKVGRLVGQQELFDVKVEGDDIETRLRTIIFDLKGGQIIAEGVSNYPSKSGKFRPGKAFTIAITGGTGAYVGVRGELVSILKSDGTYRQKFRFVD